MTTKTKMRILGVVELIAGAVLMVAMFVKYDPDGYWLAALIPSCILLTCGFFHVRDGETPEEAKEREERTWKEVNERNARNEDR